MSQTRELAKERNVFGSWFWKPGSLRIRWRHLLKGLVLGHIVMEGRGDTFGGAENLAGSFFIRNPFPRKPTHTHGNSTDLLMRAQLLWI